MKDILKKEIQKYASTARISMNEYLKQRALSDDTIKVVHAGPEILGHLASLSNFVNIIEHDDLRNEVTREVQEIWHYLNQ